MTLVIPQSRRVLKWEHYNGIGVRTHLYEISYHSLHPIETSFSYKQLQSSKAELFPLCTENGTSKRRTKRKHGPSRSPLAHASDHGRPARKRPDSPPPAFHQPSARFGAQLSPCYRRDEAVFYLQQRRGVFVLPCPLPSPRGLSRAASLVWLEAHASRGRGGAGVQLGLGCLRSGADELAEGLMLS